MPSIVWKGHLTFGLVSIPVKLFRAARRERVRLHYVHRPEPAEPPAIEPINETRPRTLKRLSRSIPLWLPRPPPVRSIHDGARFSHCPAQVQVREDHAVQKPGRSARLRPP